MVGSLLAKYGVRHAETDTSQKCALGPSYVSEGFARANPAKEGHWAAANGSGIIAPRLIHVIGGRPPAERDHVVELAVLI